MQWSAMCALFPDAQFQLRLEQLVRTCAEHPKLAALQDVLLAHFRGAPAAVDGEAGGAKSGAEPTRAIIFTNLRESVAAICALLRHHEPLIKAKCAAQHQDLMSQLHQSPAFRVHQGVRAGHEAGPSSDSLTLCTVNVKRNLLSAVVTAI